MDNLTMEQGKFTVLINLILPIEVETFKWLKAREWVFASLQQCLAGCWLENAAGDAHFWLDPLQPAWCCLNQSDRRAVKAHFPAPFPFHHIYPYFSITGFIQPPHLFYAWSWCFCFSPQINRIYKIYKSKRETEGTFFIKCKQCRRKIYCTKWH